MKEESIDVCVFEDARLNGAKNKKVRKIIKTEIRTKTQEFLERNSNSRTIEAKFQRIRLHFHSSLAEIIITRHGHIIVQTKNQNGGTLIISQQTGSSNK